MRQTLLEYMTFLVRQGRLAQSKLSCPVFILPHAIFVIKQNVSERLQPKAENIFTVKGGFYSSPFVSKSKKNDKYEYRQIL